MGKYVDRFNDLWAKNYSYWKSKSNSAVATRKEQPLVISEEELIAVSSESELWVAVLDKVLVEYLQDPEVMPNDEGKARKLTIFITQLRQHAQKALMGSILIPIDFDNFPKELESLLHMARMREKRIIEAPSQLVANSEIIVAQEGKSTKVVFIQTALLETALVAGKVEPWHLKEVNTKVDEWIHQLFTHFSDIILDAKNLNDLKQTLDDTFKQELCAELPKLNKFRNEIICHMKLLVKGGFFVEYYNLDNLAKKYEFIFDAYQDAKEANIVTPLFKLTWNKLFNRTVDKGYASCEKQQFTLMSDRENTATNVFEKLKAWAEIEWKPYEGTDFIKALIHKLEEDEKKYQLWQLVSEYENNNPIVDVKPMYQLHCMKYAGDPAQPPQDLLAKYCSPQKRKIADITSVTVNVVEGNSETKKNKSNI